MISLVVRIQIVILELDKRYTYIYIVCGKLD